MPEIDCTDAVHFLREVGGMEVPGSPTLHQIHLCVIGQSCDISIASSGMSGLAATRLLPIYLNDNDWLADEAAYTSSYCSAAGSSDVATLTPDPSTALGVVSAIAQPASGSLTSFSWGIAPIVNVDLSRQIILCWCGEKETQNSEGVCADGNSYRLIAGVLNIMGPLRGGNNMTCCKGLICVVLNLDGAGLADGDVMVVSETLDCSGGPLAGFPTAGISSSDPSLVSSHLAAKSDPSTQAGTSFSWGPATVRLAVPGSYALCWCRASSGTVGGCSRSDDFVILAGSLDIFGPSVGQIFECIMGRTCRVNPVVGVGLGQGDRIVIIDFQLNCWDSTVAQGTILGNA